MLNGSVEWSSSYFTDASLSDLGVLGTLTKASELMIGFINDSTGKLIRQ